MKVCQISKNGWYDSLYCQTKDYVFKEGQDLYVFHFKDLPRNYHGNDPYLKAYKAELSENPRTHEKSVVWEFVRIRGRIAKIIFKHYHDHYMKDDPYDGIEECQANAVIRRGKCHRMTRSRNSFNGMVPLSYGEQCIAQTFESRRNTCSYNAEIM